MEYSVGQVAKLLGLSIEGVRNYEKSGIIRSQREGDAKYRRYQYLDITSLIRSRMYRSLGYSLKETERLTNRMDLQELTASLKAMGGDLRKEQDLLHMKILWLEEQLRQLERIEEKLDQVELCEMAGFYRIEFCKNGEIRMEKDIVELVRQWVEYAPFSHISSRYGGGNVYGGMALEEKYAGFLAVRENEKIKYYPPGIALCICVKEPENGLSDVRCIERLEQFAAQHRFSLSGDPIGHTVVGIHKENHYERYRKIFAKIEIVS